MVSPGRSSVSGGIATRVCRAWYRSAASWLTSASVRVVGGPSALMGSNLEQPPPESTGPFSAVETDRLVGGQPRPARGGHEVGEVLVGRHALERRGADEDVLQPLVAPALAVAPGQAGGDQHDRGRRVLAGVAVLGRAQIGH